MYTRALTPKKLPPLSLPTHSCSLNCCSPSSSHCPGSRFGASSRSAKLKLLAKKDEDTATRNSPHRCFEQAKSSHIGDNRKAKQQSSFTTIHLFTHQTEAPKTSEQESYAVDCPVWILCVIWVILNSWTPVLHLHNARIEKCIPLVDGNKHWNSVQSTNNTMSESNRRTCRMTHTTACSTYSVTSFNSIT